MEIRILPIEPKNVEFTVWSDASWANAAERKSQGGFLIAMTDGKMSHNAWSRVSPLKWKSFKQDRQVASTLGAELLTVSRALAETCWLRLMWSEAMCAGIFFREGCSNVMQFSCGGCCRFKASV